MNRIVASLCIAALGGCALPEGGASAYVGNAPFAERFAKVAERTYYIEVLGNNLASHQTLLAFFQKKADELCKGNYESRNYSYGNRFPNGRLPDIRLDSCISGGFCNRTQAAWPLVYGTVQCKVIES
jgi:hypothetical protein